MQKILTLLLLFLTAANAQGDNKEIINRHCFRQLDAFNAKKKQTPRRATSIVSAYCFAILMIR